MKRGYGIVLFSRVSILGLGFVGLSYAVAFASRNVKVIGVDVDKQKVSQIRLGKAPFYEPNLEPMLQASLNRGYLRVTHEVESAISETDASFLTVPTPSNLDGSIDLSYIKSSAKSIGLAFRAKQGYHLVVLKSTAIPGTTEEVLRPQLEESSGKRAGRDFGLIVNPEFLREGSAIHDVLSPHKIVIGAIDTRSANAIESFYRKFYGKDIPPIFKTSPATAEIIKYANNSFLALKVSFINTIANICQNIPLGDVELVAKAMGLDPRIGPLYLRASPGYGGSCLPKDINAFINFSKKLGYDPFLLRGIQEVNLQQAGKVVDLVKRILKGLENKRIAILGLAFKKDTDDIRASPSIPVINELLQEGAKVIVHDPKAIENTRKSFGKQIEYVSSIHKCLDGADCAVILTDWDEYTQLKPNDFVKRLKTPPILVDCRRIYNPKEFSPKLTFVAIGYGNTHKTMRYHAGKPRCKP
jgi:UDPglucose 6-dehydrogenase